MHFSMSAELALELLGKKTIQPCADIVFYQAIHSRSGMSSTLKNASPHGDLSFDI